jgi:hypothetical protein
MLGENVYSLSWPTARASREVNSETSVDSQFVQFKLIPQHCDTELYRILE